MSRLLLQYYYYFFFEKWSSFFKTVSLRKCILNFNVNVVDHHKETYMQFFIKKKSMQRIFFQKSQVTNDWTINMLDRIKCRWKKPMYLESADTRIKSAISFGKKFCVWIHRICNEITGCKWCQFRSMNELELETILII